MFSPFLPKGFNRQFSKDVEERLVKNQVVVVPVQNQNLEMRDFTVQRVPEDEDDVIVTRSRHRSEASGRASTKVSRRTPGKAPFFAFFH